MSRIIEFVPKRGQQIGDTNRLKLSVKLNRLISIRHISHSQGICSRWVTINQLPHDIRTLRQDTIDRLERENARLHALIDKLIGLLL